MKLREYLSLLEDGAEVTCWDKDVDSEFYFYNDPPEEKPDPDFVNVDICTQRLLDVLDVVKVHDGGVEVNLYELLEHPTIIQYAKDHLYAESQYEDDSDVAMLLFDDNVLNISQGYDSFSAEMVKCFDLAFGGVREKQIDVNQPDKAIAFIDDEEKMRDFAELSKEEFLASYSYLTEEEYDATARLVEAGKYSISVEERLSAAKSVSEATEATHSGERSQDKEQEKE